MTALVGREQELKQLENFYKSSKAEFLAIYGRRRIGKTFLIENFYRKKEGLCFHATGLKDGNLVDQIRSFTRVIGNSFYSGAELKLKNKWIDVFDQLTEAINKTPKKQKIILFFDELPWMATPRSKLIQALDHYWNRYWSMDSRIKLIVCGSTASWILDKLIHNKGGLHNRISYQIELTPFSLAESKQFLESKKIKLNNQQILKIYMATGGIPLYLDHIQKGLSADQNIDSLCFTKSGILFKEFGEVFKSLFEEDDIHEELLKLIASFRYGISQTEIMEKSSKKTGGRLKKKLQDLEDAGFIASFVPYQHKEKGIYYRVIDEYSLFYLKWIEPVINSVKLRSKKSGYWLSKQRSSGWKSWSGYSFESICLKHINQIMDKLNIDAGAETGTWRYTPRTPERQGAQIDLLFDRDDSAMTICEIKYNQEPFLIDKAYAQKLNEKLAIFKQRSKTQKQLFLAMITANGIKPSIYSEEMVDGVVVLDDLFK